MDQKDELFCEIGIDLGMLDREQVAKAEEAFRSDPNPEPGQRIGTYLFAMKALDREQIGRILKMQARIEEANKGVRDEAVNPDSAIAKSRTVYIILALVVGFFGIHNFYAGHSKKGLVQLIVTVLLGWAAVGLIVTFVWALFDIVMVKADGSGAPLG